MAEPRISALILAAGLSSRMKTFKPLLRLGDQTLVERVIGLFAAAGIHDIVTVVGHRSDELIGVVRQTPSRWVLNASYRDGMFSSIQQGVRALDPSCDAFFLLPVDIPLVRLQSLLRLREAFQRHPFPLICYPQWGKRRGHPPLIAGRLINAILQHDGAGGGMRSLLRRYENQAYLVPVEDRYICMDADTEEEFALLHDAFTRA
jgi:molybdenum cofactor cytidylyltransferase